MQVVSVCAGIGFPHAAQPVQVVRRRRGLSGRWRTETAYPVTSLAAHQAGPADPGDTVRGPWHIENRLHRARDIVVDEDRGQIRTGNSPQIMASPRNLAIIALRLTGTTNLAAALPHPARHPNRPPHTHHLPTTTLPPPWADAEHAILADLGYEGENTRLTCPVKRTRNGLLSADQRTINALHAATRALAERGNSLLKTAFTALRRSASVLGGSARSPPRRWSCSITNTTAPHDQRAWR